jgi:excisionase family DNA binding protein
VGTVTEQSEQRLLLTVEQAARRVGLGRSTMYGLIMSGAVPNIHVGRSRRVLARGLEDFVARLVAEQGGEQ